MQRNELIRAMEDAYRRNSDMGDSLDVAVGELLRDVSRDEWDPACVEESRSPDYTITMTHSIARKVVAARRSRYLPKSDPAVEAVQKFLGESLWNRQQAEKIVAAVRKADAK